MVDIDASVEILPLKDNPTEAEACIRALKRRNLANKLLWIMGGGEAFYVLFQIGSFSGRRTNDNPKVVLPALHLPKIDGLDILREVRTEERTKTIPIVVLNSSKERADIAEAHKLGANSFITKPVEFDCFVETFATLGLYWLVTNKAAARKRKSE